MKHHFSAPELPDHDSAVGFLGMGRLAGGPPAASQCHVVGNPAAPCTVADLSGAAGERAAPSPTAEPTPIAGAGVPPKDGVPGYSLA